MFAPLQSSQNRYLRRAAQIRRLRRRAFTLIELLVVITVIAILVGLLLPAISAVRRGVFETSVATDIAQLDAAVERFKDEFGFYPSDFSEFLDNDGIPIDFDQSLVAPGFSGTVESRLLQILAKISPTHNERATEPLFGSTGPSRLEHWWSTVGKRIAHNDINSSEMPAHETPFHRTRGPQVALWFWLTQLHNDAQFPLTGARDIATPNPAVITSERRSFYDFTAGSLQQLAEIEYPTVKGTNLANGDPAYGVFRVLQRGGDAPIVYFHNSTYSLSGIDFDYDADYVPASSGYGDSSNFAAALIVRPDPDKDFSTTEYFNPAKFQIFTAGYSESFGNYNLNIHTPANPEDIERINQGDPDFEKYNECADNLASFADGRIDTFLENQN